MAESDAIDSAQREGAPRLSRREFGARAVAVGASISGIAALAAACGGGQQGSGQTAGTGAGGPAVNLSATPEAPGYIPRPASEIDLPITQPLTKQKVTLRVFVQQQPTVQDFNTNAFTSWLEDKTNVHVEWIVVPADSAQATNKLNVMLSSGDYPDIIFDLVNRSQQLVYGEQGVFIALNDLIDKYAPRTKELYKNYPDAKTTTTAPNGKIYAMPNVNDCYHCQLPFRMWIYKPWLDKLGLKMPQTTDEFEQVLLAFKTKDPNGNGKKDVVPLATSTWTATSGQGLDVYLMNAFLYNPGAPWLVLNKGKVDVVYTKDQWKEGLKYIRRLYQQGLIAPESFTQSSDQLKQMGNHPGDVILGASPNLWWGSFMTVDEAHGGRWTEYVAVPPLKGPKGVHYAVWSVYQAVGGGTVITKACKHPEVAVQWIDAMYWREATLRSVQGVLDKDWRWATQDEKGINGQKAVWFQTNTWGQPWNESWMQRGPSYRSSFTRLSEAVQAGHPSYENMLYNEAKDKMWPNRQPKDNVLPPLFFNQDQANSISQSEATITQHVLEMFAKFVRGDVDIDSGWSKYLSDLRGMGLAAYLKSYQDAYNAKHK